MSKLSERCEQRKKEAQALADKYNAGKAEEDKLRNENAQTLEQFKIINAKYGELLELVQEEEGVTTASKVVE
tara:strand:+ start:412 stop:627 length:216 start_codon:yes stop_codon:yes gene_type:complete